MPHDCSCCITKCIYTGRGECADAASPSPAPAAHADDSAALDKLAELLNKRGWSTSLVVDVAELVRSTGRDVP